MPPTRTSSTRVWTFQLQQKFPIGQTFEDPDYLFINMPQLKRAHWNIGVALIPDQPEPDEMEQIIYGYVVFKDPQRQSMPSKLFEQAIWKPANSQTSAKGFRPELSEADKLLYAFLPEDLQMVYYKNKRPGTKVRCMCKVPHKCSTK